MSRPRSRSPSRPDSEPPTSAVPLPDQHATRLEGLVLGVMPRHVSVHTSEGTLVTMLPPRWQGNALAVGDRVTVVLVPGGSLLESLHPRTGVLSRPDPHDATMERVIAANIDRVVLVVSVDSPPLHVRLIDRYLVAAVRAQTHFTVCVNKFDRMETQLQRDEVLESLRPYREAGADVVTVSAQTREGLDTLWNTIRGKMTVFAGHSGVGKSTLVNALVPDAQALTGEISEVHGRGKHTTTRSMLYRCADGTCLIDTPGVRGFGLWGVAAEQLGWYFPDFAEPASRCRFRDCTHTHEPRCGVREAVVSQQVPAARYETYLRILASLRENERGWS